MAFFAGIAGFGCVGAGYLLSNKGVLEREADIEYQVDIMRALVNRESSDGVVKTVRSHTVPLSGGGVFAALVLTSGWSSRQSVVLAVDRVRVTRRCHAPVYYPTARSTRISLLLYMACARPSRNAHPQTRLISRLYPSSHLHPPRPLLTPFLTRTWTISSRRCVASGGTPGTLSSPAPTHPSPRGSPGDPSPTSCSRVSPQPRHTSPQGYPRRARSTASNLSVAKSATSTMHQPTIKRNWSKHTHAPMVAPCHSFTAVRSRAVSVCVRACVCVCVAATEPRKRNI